MTVEMPELNLQYIIDCDYYLPLQCLSDLKAAGFLSSAIH